MRVLTKADLENAILLRELIVIMENFGINDDGEGDGEFSGSANNNGEDPEASQKDDEPQPS